MRAPRPRSLQPTTRLPKSSAPSPSSRPALFELRRIIDVDGPSLAPQMRIQARALRSGVARCSSPRLRRCGRVRVCCLRARCIRRRQQQPRGRRSTAVLTAFVTRNCTGRPQRRARAESARVRIWTARVISSLLAAAWPSVIRATCLCVLAASMPAALVPECGRRKLCPYPGADLSHWQRPLGEKMHARTGKLIGYTALGRADPSVMTA